MESHQFGLTTSLLHADLDRTPHGETSEAIFLTSGFVYDSAEQAAATFKGEENHFQYSRFGNPTTDTLQDRLARLEGAEACIVTSTGMGAISSALLAHAKSGDRVVASRALFGSCHWIIATLLPRYGIETVFVDVHDEAGWEDALSVPTAAVLIETPSNPMLDIIDIQKIADLSHRAGALLMVDNVFASPIGQKPLSLGADVVLYSCTKHIDGQGRVLGGAILGRADWIKDVVQPFTRNTGNSLSPFNAWILLKGLETLPLRDRAMASSAALVADFLAGHEAIEKLHYPGRSDHPAATLIRQQMSHGGSLIAFKLRGDQQKAFRFMNALKLIAISNNLGDSRSLITHPASTTHMRVPAEDRAQLGITEAVLRLSIGLEETDDLITDLAQALDKMDH